MPKPTKAQEVIFEDAVCSVRVTEEEDRFYLRRTVKANPRVPAEYSMTAAELDALCEWWTKKKQAKEVSTEIERLREQNRELREALRPFAAFEYADRWPDDELLFYHNGAEVTIGDVRRAKAVLEKG